MNDQVKAIRAEIERLKEETAIGICEYDKGEENGRMEVLTSLLSFIDSLPDENPEPEICSRCVYHHKDDGYCYEPHGGKSSWINENGVYKCTGFDPLQDEKPKIDAPYEVRFVPAKGFDLGSVNVYRDGNLVAQYPQEMLALKWKWIDPKYEYPLCLTREMDEFGDWHYSLSSGKISETCQYISLAQLERLPDEPFDVEAAMKNLDEKIKLTKEHGSWKGIDVDKFMDEVRGRDTDGLEEEIQKYMSERWEFGCINPTTPVYLYNFTTDELKEVARHFAEWQKEQMMDGWLKDRDGCFWDGVEEGKKAMREQMTKEAVEGEISIRGYNGAEGKGFVYEGDKVKLIILKEQ